MSSNIRITRACQYCGDSLTAKTIVTKFYGDNCAKKAYKLSPLDGPKNSRITLLQIGLMIFSSDAEFTLLSKPGTELTVDLNGTVLSLPVVGGKGIMEKAVK